MCTAILSTAFTLVSREYLEGVSYYKLKWNTEITCMVFSVGSTSLDLLVLKMCVKILKGDNSQLKNNVPL